MRIQVGNYNLDKFTEVMVSLKYNSIADTFGMRVYFDPENAQHKAIFKPCSYLACKIYFTNGNGENELVMVGTLLNNNFNDSAKEELNTISGYSKTGILKDVCVFTGPVPTNPNESIQTDGSIQFVNMSLKEITAAVIGPYGLGEPVIDANVAAECDQVFSMRTAKVTESVASFLQDASTQLHVVLSHTGDGQLLYTRSKALSSFKSADIAQSFKPQPVDTGIAGAPVLKSFGNSIVAFNGAPIYHFERGQALWTHMSLNVDGQKMHSDINAVGQQNAEVDNNNAADSSIKNPYVLNAFRYIRAMQTSGDDNDTPDTARDALGDELRSITLSVDIAGWEINKRLIRPNQIITVLNQKVYCYKSVRWFIESVDFKEDAKSRTCTMNCVLPEVYNDEDVINIFA